jgi:thioredoxin 1
MGQPEAVSDSEFQSKVIESSTPVLVDFWAEWCGPCKMIAPVVDKLAEQYDGRVTFAKMDVDANPATPGSFGIRGIPTLLVFDGGKEVDRIVGFASEQDISSKLEAVLGAS